MKYLGVIAISLCTLFYMGGTVASDGQSAAPTESRIIKVENNWSYVNLSTICLYSRDNPSVGVCHTLAPHAKESVIGLSSKERPSQIQRIAVTGVAEKNSKNITLTCLLKITKPLDDLKDYVAQINYAAGSFMICNFKESTT